MKSKPKIFLFFNLFPNAIYFSLIGIFLTLFLVFANFYVLTFLTIHFRLCLYLLVGAGIFLISYFLYRYFYFSTLKIPSYKSYLIAHEKLLWWIIITLNIYLLFCWYLMFIFGIFNGFDIKTKISNPDALLLIDNAENAKQQGITLLLIHSFILIFLWYLKNYLKQLFLLTHQTLISKRQHNQMIREEAKKQFYD